jgi:hypothetical protein
MANIRLNALILTSDIIYELDEEYREVQSKVYALENGPEKTKFLRELENVSKVRGRYKYKRFKIKQHIRKRNEYNATKSYG